MSESEFNLEDGAPVSLFDSATQRLAKAIEQILKEQPKPTPHEFAKALLAALYRLADEDIALIEQVLRRTANHSTSHSAPRKPGRATVTPFTPPTPNPRENP